MAAKNNSASVASVVPSREEFVREYMASLSATRKPKVSIVDRLVGYAEDRLVSGVKNSRRTVGRLQAAWEISDSIREEAYAREHAAHAEAVAARLGLK